MMISFEFLPKYKAIRNLHFTILFKLGKRGNYRIPKDVLTASFIIVSMLAKNIMISC